VAEFGQAVAVAGAALPQLVMSLWTELEGMEENRLKSSLVDCLLSNMPAVGLDTLRYFLSSWTTRHKTAVVVDHNIGRLWIKVVEMLLERSESPPAKIPTWTQRSETQCKCTCCRKLVQFALSPTSQNEIYSSQSPLNATHYQEMVKAHFPQMTVTTKLATKNYTVTLKKVKTAELVQMDKFRADCAGMQAMLQMLGGGSNPTLAPHISRLRQQVAKAK